MLVELDKIDKQILNLLQKNSRITTKEISEKLGLTKTPIYERIKKLERKGIIKSYFTLLDHKKIEKNLIVYINVLLSQHTREVVNAFVDKINSFPEVMECYYISGNADFLLKVYCKDMDDYHEFIMNKFSIIGNVNQFYSSFVLEESKYEGRFLLE
ncbi:MAG: Lrp/AsnC family transcriptional regulator [Chlorobi bacterium]|nr:Lrp/AsnC family transcriptional regulator [Chlorobiota bacterium]